MSLTLPRLSLQMPTQRTMATAALMGSGVLAAVVPDLAPHLAAMAPESISSYVERGVGNLPYFSGYYGIALSSIWVHEQGHAITARKLGYQIEKIVVHWSGLYGYAKFAEGEGRRCWSNPRDNLLITAAGPAASLALGGVLYGVASALNFQGANPEQVFPYLLNQACYLNILTAKLNMLPIPMLDGFAVFYSLGQLARSSIDKLIKT